MMLQRNIIPVMIVAASLATPFFAGAQDIRKISPREAIDLSIRNSNQLKYATARTTETNAALKEAKERKLPGVSVSGSHLRLNNPNVDLKVKSDDNNGGNSSGESMGKISSATYGMVTFSLPVYAGSSIRYGIASARYLAEAARLEEQHDRQGIILNTIHAFDNLYKAKAAMDLVKENLESAEERVKQFTSLERNGVIPRNDLLKAELQQSNTELSLLDAENDWKLANINMDILLGLPDTTVLEPEISSFPQPDKLPGVEEFMQAARNRSDMAALELKRKAADVGVKAVKSGLYPSVALTAGYIALHVPNLVTVTNAVNAGIGIQYDLASLWKTGSKIEQAKAREIQAEANQGMLSDAIRTEVHKAYLDYVLSIKKIDTYESAVAQAEENYKIVKNKYDNALATTTDLLDADVAQLQSRLDIAFSQADAWAAYCTLLKAAGMLETNVSTDH